jgi:hypothetical protein
MCRSMPAVWSGLECYDLGATGGFGREISGLTIPGTPATVSRKIARFRTFLSVNGPHLKKVKVSNDQRATLTAAYAIRSADEDGSTCVFVTAFTSPSDHTGCAIGLSQKFLMVWVLKKRIR